MVQTKLVYNLKKKKLFKVYGYSSLQNNKENGKVTARNLELIHLSLAYSKYLKSLYQHSRKGEQISWAGWPSQFSVVEAGRSPSSRPMVYISSLVKSYTEDPFFQEKTIRKQKGRKENCSFHFSCSPIWQD